MDSKSLYQDIIALQLEKLHIYKEDYFRLKEKEKETEAYYDGEPVPFLYTPRLFSPEEMDNLYDLVEKSVELFDRVVELYMEKEDFRELFGFPKKIEELILLGSPLPRAFPMARMDIFYRGKDDFEFCEINTDGSSAMNEDRVLTELFYDSKLYEALSEDYEFESFELFDSWVDFVLSTWSGDGLPTIAIMDTNVDNDEFRRFAKHFEARGSKVALVTPWQLELEDGYLAKDGLKFDYIYRRLVTTDFEEIYDEVPDLVQGIKEGKTILVGPIASQIIHNKVLFYVLHHPRVQDYFTEEQQAFIRAHFPFTAIVDERIIEDSHFVVNRSDYLLKPMDSYAARGVYLGSEMDEELWLETLKKVSQEEYLIQAFAKLPSIDMMSYTEGVRSFNHMTGIYVYNGELKGFLSRACQGPIIAGPYGGKTLATLTFKKRED